MTALRKFTGGRSLEAMLTQATVATVEGNALTLTHKSEPLARRLSDQDNARKIAGALTDVLGGDWQVRCVHGNAPAASAARPQQAAAAPERSFTRQSAAAPAAPPAPAEQPSRPAPTASAGAPEGHDVRAGHPAAPGTRRRGRRRPLQRGRQPGPAAAPTAAGPGPGRGGPQAALRPPRRPPPGLTKVREWHIEGLRVPRCAIHGCSGRPGADARHPVGLDPHDHRRRRPLVAQQVLRQPRYRWACRSSISARDAQVVPGCCAPWAAWHLRGVRPD